MTPAKGKKKLTENKRRGNRMNKHTIASNGMLSLPDNIRHLIIKASYRPTVSREEEVLTYLLAHGATDSNSKIKMDKDQTLSKLIKAGHVEEKNGKFFLTDMGKMVASGALILYPELK